MSSSSSVWRPRNARLRDIWFQSLLRGQGAAVNGEGVGETSQGGLTPPCEPRGYCDQGEDQRRLPLRVGENNPGGEARRA
ncbi:hypothetical protein B6V72_13380 [Thioclava sp. F34-6]|nr:hypothetical protein B6V72_13380 [Thioclava sp. F34-6]